MTEEPAPVSPRLVMMTTPMNPTTQSDDAVDPHRLVGQEERRQDDREERDRRGQDRRQRRLDRLLGPGDEQERDRDVDDRHHQQVAVDPPLARQRLVGDPDDGPQEERADDQPERDERERPEVVDRELDEQVARAPHEAEREEDQPVDPVGAVVHRRMIPGLAYGDRPILAREGARC